MRHLWYDIDGNPIPVEQANELLMDIDKRRVALTNLGGWEISTVHLVLDHSLGFIFPDGTVEPPMIFETMAFAGERDDEDFEDVYGPVRYATRDAALAGHDQAVAEIRGRLAEIERITTSEHAPTSED